MWYIQTMTEQAPHIDKMSSGKRVSHILADIRSFIFGPKVPENMFPSVLAEQIKQGAAVPAIYSGPLYIDDPERMAVVLADLDERCSKMTETYDHSLSPLENAIAQIEDRLPDGAFGTPPDTGS